MQSLRAKLKPRHIRSRTIDGMELHYLEGWHVIAEANRIFGFDGWNRETVETKCVWSKQNGSRFSVSYLTRIRISVFAGETTIVREGSGSGEAHESTAGLAHERAAKAAETDATKRALMTFGNAFGLSLYGGQSPAPTAPDIASKQIARGVKLGKAITCHNRGTSPQSVGTTREADAAPENNGRSNLHSCSVIGSGQANDSGEKDIQSNQHHAQAVPVWPAIAPLEEAARIAEARGRIDKSQLALGEPNRARDKDHLRRVASRPCLVCGRNRCQAHHLTYLQPRAMGRKVSDEFTVPLCSRHHQELHAHGNERDWWQRCGIDPEPIARSLWEQRENLQVDR
jgi:DNA recombination protein Rad52